MCPAGDIRRPVHGKQVKSAALRAELASHAFPELRGSSGRNLVVHDSGLLLSRQNCLYRFQLCGM